MLRDALFTLTATILLVAPCVAETVWNGKPKVIDVPTDGRPGVISMALITGQTQEKKDRTELKVVFRTDYKCPTRRIKGSTKGILVDLMKADGSTKGDFILLDHAIKQPDGSYTYTVVKSPDVESISIKIMSGCISDFQ